MKTKSIIIFFLVAISLLIQTSCKKEGPQGPAGLDGNANVIASAWITPAAWNGQTGDWFFQVASGAITQDIVENGVILAYMSVPNDIYSAAVRPLPAFAIGCNWDFLIPEYGKIEFTSDALNAPGTANYYFRFILITSSKTLKSGSINGLNKSELQNMPYKDVCKKFGIAE